MKRYLLRPLREGYNNQYNPKMDPSVSNEFSSASFRLVGWLIWPHTHTHVLRLAGCFFFFSFTHLYYCARFGHVMIPDLFYLFTKKQGLKLPMDGNDVCFGHNLFK